MPATTTRPRALLVYKKSMYQLYTVDRRNREVEQLLARGDPSVDQLVAAHETHLTSLAATQQALKQAGFEVNRTYRAGLDEIAEYDLVVTVGGDGTLLDVSHHVGPDIPMLGVNSDPLRSVGLLMAAAADSVSATLDAIRGRRLRPYRVARLALELNGTQLGVLALNDVLVTNFNPAATSRYQLICGRRAEAHKSSGVWIASAVGSSAAIHSAGGTIQRLTDGRLQYLVREPYTGGGPVGLRRGMLAPRRALILHSAMRTGRIYVDGPHTWFGFGLGDHLEVRSVPGSLALYLSADNLRRRAALTD